MPPKKNPKSSQRQSRKTTPSISAGKTTPSISTEKTTSTSRGNTTSSTPNSHDSKCENVTCPKTKMCNPASGKCVLRTGTIGRKILKDLKELDAIKKQLRDLERESHISGPMIQRIQDLGSDDPEIRERSMQVLSNETNPRLKTFLRKYSHILIFGLATVSAATLAYALGHPHVQAIVSQTSSPQSKDLIVKDMASLMTTGTSLSQHISEGAPESYTVYENILKALDSTSEKPGDLLLAAFEGLKKDPTVCTEGWGSVYVDKFVNLFQRHMVTMVSLGENTQNIHGWIQAFTKMRTMCARK